MIAEDLLKLDENEIKEVDNNISKTELDLDNLKLTPTNKKGFLLLPPNFITTNHKSDNRCNFNAEPSICNSDDKIFEDSNLLKELEDPGNSMLKIEIEKIIQLHREVSMLKIDYDEISRLKTSDQIALTNSKNIDLETEKNNKISYTYYQHLQGLTEIIQEFIIKTNTSKNNKQCNNSFSGKISLKKGNSFTNEKSIEFSSLNSPRKNSKKNSLDELYNSLGHVIYTNLIKIFEKYCFYGKTLTNFNMDYSQFTILMKENNIFDDQITKMQSEIIFNKTRNNNKSINFEEFIILLIEISKLVFNWEQNFIKSFTYFVNKYMVNLPSLLKTDDEKNLERYYYFLEKEEFIREIKKHIPFLRKIFLKNKVKDLKISECIDTTNFIKMSKELQIVPYFLSAKEISNFVKYRKKSLIPTNNFDFCSFVEINCLIALQAFSNNEPVESKYIDHIEKLKTFFRYIYEKI